MRKINPRREGLRASIRKLKVLIKNTGTHLFGEDASAAAIMAVRLQALEHKLDSLVWADTTLNRLQLFTDESQIK